MENGNLGKQFEEVVTGEVIERFSKCDYCGTMQRIGATEDAETCCPTCGAKRHEVLEKRLLKKQVEIKKEEPPKQPEPVKGGFAWNGLGKILLFIIVVILIGSVVYVISAMK